MVACPPCVCTGGLRPVHTVIIVYHRRKKIKRIFTKKMWKAKKNCKIKIYKFMHILKIELFPLLHHIFFNNFLLSLNIFIISSIYSFLVTDFLHSYGNGKLICFAIKFIKIDLGASKMLDSV